MGDRRRKGHAGRGKKIKNSREKVHEISFELTKEISVRQGETCHARGFAVLAAVSPLCAAHCGAHVVEARGAFTSIRMLTREKRQNAISPFLSIVWSDGEFVSIPRGVARGRLYLAFPLGGRCRRSRRKRGVRFLSGHPAAWRAGAYISPSPLGEGVTK